MLHYSMRLHSVSKTLAEIPILTIYEHFYGFTSKDLGLYALVDNQLAGAVWIRRLNADHGSNGYVDDTTPVMNIAVIPEFRGQGLGSMMLEQLFVEAGALHESISLSVQSESPAVRFYERHGFSVYESGFKKKSPVDGSEVVTMVKKLQKAEIKRPSDGYDPRRWMD